jgi:hypothetical protein
VGATQMAQVPQEGSGSSAFWVLVRDSCRVSSASELRVRPNPGVNQVGEFCAEGLTERSTHMPKIALEKPKGL